MCRIPPPSPLSEATPQVQVQGVNPKGGKCEIGMEKCDLSCSWCDRIPSTTQTTSSPDHTWSIEGWN